jgi:predicted alpha/beta superfamily hydrolase
VGAGLRRLRRALAWAWLTLAAAGVLAQPVRVRFEVDLRAEIEAGRFDPSRDGVELRGGFAPLSWSQGLPLVPAGEGAAGRWTLVVEFPRRPAGGQAVPHKFRVTRLGQGADQGWEPGPNHRALLQDESPLVARVFGAAVAPTPSQLTGMVLSLGPLPAGHGQARPVWVWLPPRYAEEPQCRYPVLYLHDGQNMFDARAAGAEWQVDETAQRLVAAGTISPFIAVAVASGPDRLHELTPTPGGRGGGGLPDHARWLLDELKPEIDRRFRTRPGPSDTAVGGSSLGGIASLWMALHRADRVGAALVVSPAMWWDGEWPRRDVLATPPPEPRPRLWLGVGAQEAAGMVGQAQALHAALRTRAWPAARLAYAEDAEGRHDELSWAAQVEGMLRFLFPAPALAPAPVEAAPGALRQCRPLE